MSTFKYNADGMRTYKGTDSYDTFYFYDSENNLIALQQNGTVAYFHYNSNGEVTSMTFDETKYFFIKNQQGDVEKIVDRMGNVQVSYTYDAWGKVLSVDDDSFYTISQFNPFGYRGYVYDKETGLYYLQSRYYDPQTGRFLNADDTAYLGATKTALSCNAFAYCENNPVDYIDFNGHNSYRIGSSDFTSDEFGVQILVHYLTGNGETLNIKNNSKWKKYLSNAKMCDCSAHEKYGSTLTLRQYIKKLINKKKVKLPTSLYKTKVTKTKAAITNGEGIVGYNYLHGTNANVGGLKLKIKLVKKKGKLYYRVTTTWNDRIDPNFNYESDKKKQGIAEALPGVNPTSYTIRITWTTYYKK